MSQSKKARKTAVPTVRSTGGPGYDFEDHVSAWLLTNAVCGHPTPVIGGRAELLQAQSHALGWHIDDLLLTSCNGTSRRLAISAKANVQVSSAGLPKDFVTLAWKQWEETGGPFRRGSDALALVTAHVAAS